MPGRQVYLDNSATTRPYPEVVQAVVEAMEVYYGNPSSLHKKGVEASRVLIQAREAVAASLGVGSGEIVFTGGGTEAINLALKGVLPGRRGRHVITTAVEHPAVLNTCEQLKAQGVEVTVLPVDGQGVLEPGQLQKALRDDTYLVSVMYVNNEVGAVQPLEEIAAVLADLRRGGRKLLWHVDAVQAYGKLSVRPRELGVDLLSVSAHKVHGPKGVGALYVASHTQLQPLLAGGGQEHGLRSGTENVPGIAGFGVAAAIIAREVKGVAGKIFSLKKRLVDGIMAAVPGAVLNGPACRQDNPRCAPQIANLSFPGLRGEILLHSLEERGIYVSTGSACASRKNPGSHVLKAMGATGELLEGALRFSLSPMTTVEEIDYTVEQTAAVVRELYALYN
ncbi:Cysteine desulfurase [Sporotomaculum syntrophicum]|uniref:cysteine desulfurase n=1 Tax=Sporotomaculum syntrophicum TaxID=182264 RepID=A0A9D2WSK2_9FIRM|nr:cysteine desulfurase family protein [Sporotomaculum syntrophicum]KAF1086136.1 Cysteine desulfurase [Sporotomaculum syntrophicum]